MPLRRTRLVFSALVVGTVAPDLDDYVRLLAGGGWGHTIIGAFCLSLPLGLATLWLFHRYAKLPVIELLPERVECRLGPFLEPFRFRGRFLLIAGSMLAGIATHIVWDSFTHQDTWLYDHWAFLHHVIRLPDIRSIHVYFFLQLISSAGGILVLLAWFVHWYRTTPPGSQPLSTTFRPGQKVFIVAAMVLLSLAGGAVRVYLHRRHFRYSPGLVELASSGVVTVTALLWWQLVGLGAVLRMRMAKRVSDSTPVAG